MHTRINNLVGWTFLYLLATLPALSQPVWHPTKTAVTFVIRNAGLAVTGSFSGFAGNLTFDPAKPAQSKLVATIETATLSTGIGMRDNHLRKTDYFDVDTYPRISLTSVTLEKKADMAYSGIFDLTIKATTRRVTIPFTFTQTGSTGQFLGQFMLNRLDYQVGKSSFLMSNNVTISLTIQVQSSL